MPRCFRSATYGVGSDLVAQRDHAQRRFPPAHGHDRSAGVLELSDARCDDVQGEPLRGAEARAAHHRPRSGDRSRHAKTGEGLEISASLQRDPPFESRLDDRPGDRMLGRGLGGRCRAEERVFVPGHCLELAHSETSFGQGAGLVQDDVADLAERLKGLATSHDHAPFGGGSGASHDRQRSGDADRAGIAHHQNAQAREHGSIEVRRPIEQQRQGGPREKRNPRESDDRGRVDAEDEVDQVEHPRLHGAGVLDVADDLCEEALFPDRADSQQERARAIDGAPDHRVALLLCRRHGLPRHE